MVTYTLSFAHFDSLWNWMRQDAPLMYCDIIHDRLTTVDRELTAWLLISTALVPTSL